MSFIFTATVDVLFCGRGVVHFCPYLLICLGWFMVYLEYFSFLICLRMWCHWCGLFCTLFFYLLNESFFKVWKMASSRSKKFSPVEETN